MLNKNKIPFIQHTMMTHVIEQSGKVVGAVGFQVTTGAIITVHAKAVIMCTGTGSIQPTGHCTGSDTFDGEYIATTHGSIPTRATLTTYG
jgi:succinate dehydrogenase/fumarate reductase flavoprotein subunit